MSTVPNGTRFIGISTSVDLTERKSALLNKTTEPFTIEDIANTVGAGSQGAQGVQGPAGPLGPVGPAGLNWQGAWVSGSAYVSDDAVGDNGASYFCILGTSGTTAPHLDATHWALLASQGAQGIQGVQGPTGAQGIQGPGATQTLQQTVELGNTIISGDEVTYLIAGGLSIENLDHSTQIQPAAIRLDYNNFGIFISSTSVNWSNDENYSTKLEISPNASANRAIKLPDASGTIALQTYKSYMAIISQAGTGAPTVDTLLENTLGGTITFEYLSLGTYRVVSPVLFTNNKTTVTVSNGYYSPTIISAYNNSTSRIIVSCNDLSGALVNDSLIRSVLEIRVYA